MIDRSQKRVVQNEAAAIFRENSAIYSAGATTAAGRGSRRARLICHMRKPVMPNKSGRNPDKKTSTVQI